MTAPIPPHGGLLVDLRLPPEQVARLRVETEALPRLRIDHRALADLEMLAVGAMSPLQGFMGQKDYLGVLEHMRLADGTVWPLPITLRVSREALDRIGKAERVGLEDGDGILAVLEIEDRFAADRSREAQAVFGTTDPAHPGVGELLRAGEFCLGGRLSVLRLPVRREFAAYRLDPAQTRARFAAQGWRTVAAFQTRNPIHRAHEYLQKCAMELVDGLLLHPLVGATKQDDVPAAVRMRTYEVIFRHYYPAGRSMIAVFPAHMRYAGPREALFHALCRKNYGCSHLIVGRDHAGVGKYYGPYDSQRIFSRFTAAEIGITPLLFENAVYCRRCDNMATVKTCPHEPEHHLLLSGTEVRRMLAAGKTPPKEFTRPEVAQILVEAYGRQGPHSLRPSGETSP